MRSSKQRAGERRLSASLVGLQIRVPGLLPLTVLRWRVQAHSPCAQRLAQEEFDLSVDAAKLRRSETFDGRVDRRVKS